MTVAAALGSTGRALAFLFGSTIALPSASADPACRCGPLYCPNPTAYAAALAKKKNALKSEYPERLLQLLDRIGKCEGCITTAPNGFSLVLVYSAGGKVTTLEWTDDGERIARNQLASGELREFLVINAKHSCACCGDAPYQSRPDYDSTLDLNRKLALSCKYVAAAKRVDCAGPAP